MAGAGAFWVANLAISWTSVANDYRAALSIAYLPMLAEAAGGGLALASIVAFALTRFAEHLPGHDSVAKALVLSIGALAVLTVVVGVPSVLGPGLADRGHWLLVGLVINAIRILALGLAVGLVTRLRVRPQNRARRASRRRTPS